MRGPAVTGLELSAKIVLLPVVGPRYVKEKEIIFLIPSVLVITITIPASTHDGVKQYRGKSWSYLLLPTVVCFHLR